MSHIFGKLRGCVSFLPGYSATLPMGMSQAVRPFLLALHKVGEATGSRRCTIRRHSGAAARWVRSCPAPRRADNVRNETAQAEPGQRSTAGNWRSQDSVANFRAVGNDNHVEVVAAHSIRTRDTLRWPCPFLTLATVCSPPCGKAYHTKAELSMDPDTKARYRKDTFSTLG
jgi:hypothetical protein